METVEEKTEGTGEMSGSPAQNTQWGEDDRACSIGRTRKEMVKLDARGSFGPPSLRIKSTKNRCAIQ